MRGNETTAGVDSLGLPTRHTGKPHRTPRPIRTGLHSVVRYDVDCDCAVFGRPVMEIARTVEIGGVYGTVIGVLIIGAVIWRIL